MKNKITIALIAAIFLVCFLQGIRADSIDLSQGQIQLCTKSISWNPDEVSSSMACSIQTTDCGTIILTANQDSEIIINDEYYDVSQGTILMISSNSITLKSGSLDFYGEILTGSGIFYDQDNILLMDGTFEDSNSFEQHDLKITGKNIRVYYNPENSTNYTNSLVINNLQLNSIIAKGNFELDFWDTRYKINRGQVSCFFENADGIDKTVFSFDAQVSITKAEKIIVINNGIYFNKDTFATESITTPLILIYNNQFVIIGDDGKPINFDENTQKGEQTREDQIPVINYDDIANDKNLLFQYIYKKDWQNLKAYLEVLQFTDSTEYQQTIDFLNQRYAQYDTNSITGSVIGSAQTGNSDFVKTITQESLSQTDLMKLSSLESKADATAMQNVVSNGPNLNLGNQLKGLFNLVIGPYSYQYFQSMDYTASTLIQRFGSEEAAVDWVVKNVPKDVVTARVSMVALPIMRGTASQTAQEKGFWEKVRQKMQIKDSDVASTAEAFAVYPAMGMVNCPQFQNIPGEKSTLQKVLSFFRRSKASKEATEVVEVASPTIATVLQDGSPKPVVGEAAEQALEGASAEKCPTIVKTTAQQMADEATTAIPLSATPMDDVEAKIVRGTTTEVVAQKEATQIAKLSNGEVEARVDTEIIGPLKTYATEHEYNPSEIGVYFKEKSETITKLLQDAGDQETQEAILNFLKRGQEYSTMASSTSEKVWEVAGSFGSFGYNFNYYISLVNILVQKGDKDLTLKTISIINRFEGIHSYNVMRIFDSILKGTDTPEKINFLKDFMNNLNKIKDPETVSQILNIFGDRPTYMLYNPNNMAMIKELDNPELIDLMNLYGSEGANFFNTDRGGALPEGLIPFFKENYQTINSYPRYFRDYLERYTYSPYALIDEQKQSLQYIIDSPELKEFFGKFSDKTGSTSEKVFNLFWQNRGADVTNGRPALSVIISSSGKWESDTESISTILDAIIKISKENPEFSSSGSLNGLVTSASLADKAVVLEEYSFMYSSIGTRETIPIPSLTKDFADFANEKIPPIIQEKYGLSELPQIDFCLAVINEGRNMKEGLPQDAVKAIFEGSKNGITKNFPTNKEYGRIVVGSGMTTKQDFVEATKQLVNGLIGKDKTKISAAQDFFGLGANKLDAARRYTLTTFEGGRGGLVNAIRPDLNLLMQSNDKDAAGRILDFLETNIVNKGATPQKVESLSDLINSVRGLRISDSQMDFAILKTMDASSPETAISNLGGSNDLMCCAFYPNGVNKKASVGYTLDPDLGLLQLKRTVATSSGIVEREPIGVAIFAITKDQSGKKVLLIDSVEGGVMMNNIADRVWKDTFFDGIVKLAKDIDVDYIFFNAEVGNAKPKEFVSYLENVKQLSIVRHKIVLEKNPINLPIVGKESYLEALGWWVSGGEQLFAESGFVLPVK